MDEREHATTDRPVDSHHPEHPHFYFIYGPGASDPDAVRAVRFLFVPVVVLSGLWLWKGHVLVRRLKLIYRSHVAE